MAKKASQVQSTCHWFICAVLLVMTVATSAYAKLTPLKNRDMEEVWGSAGIIIAPKNVQIFLHIDLIRYSAPEDSSRPDGSGYIEFHDFEMGGNGDVARFNYDSGAVTSNGIMFFDVAETEVAPVNDWSGAAIGPGDEITRGMTLLRVPKWDQELSFTVGNISLFDPKYPTVATAAPVDDLGAFTIGLIDMPRFETYTSPPIGGIGFDWQHNFQMTIDKIGYYYNTNHDALVFSPIYLGGSFADLAGDDPRFPTTWKPNQATPVDFGDFQIGDLFGDINAGKYSNPAGIDVGEQDFDGAGPLPVLGAVKLTLPIEGSIRFENATFAGTDFGPGAIDGIHAYRLGLFLVP